jgi:hypothetical protein
MFIGSARVSTDDPHLDLQRDALAKAGGERVFEEAISGTKTARLGLMGRGTSSRRCSTTRLIPSARPSGVTRCGPSASRADEGTPDDEG